MYCEVGEPSDSDSWLHPTNSGRSSYSLEDDQSNFKNIKKEKIRTSFLMSNSLSSLCNMKPIQAKDYSDQAQQIQVSSLYPLGAIVYAIASRKNALKHSFAMQNDTVMAWANLSDITDSEYSSIFQNYFKNGYKCTEKELTISQMINPSADSLDQLSSFRHDYPSGRAVFHFIGYGFPPISENGICVRNSTNGQPLIFSFTKLLEKIQTPSVFIFDCENAEHAINALKNNEEKILENFDGNEIPKYSSTAKYYMKREGWDDCYCLCATTLGGKLPVDPSLPRDFLSSCLLTPIPLAILCHILRYFRTSFGSYSPLDIINKILASDQEESISQLQKVIVSITESIASDFLTAHLFVRFFRREPFIAMLFQRFILAQFLLNDYNVVPVSHPHLPAMWHHPLWMQWRAMIDSWVCSKLTPPLSFTDQFYHGIAVSFTTAVMQGQAERIKQSLITAAANIPFSKNKDSQSAFVQLARLASEFPEIRPKIVQALETPVLIHSLSQFMEDLNSAKARNEPITPIILHYHALGYLVACALQSSTSSITGIVKNLNIMKLIDASFCVDLPTSTRALLVAITAMLMRPVSQFRKPFLSIDFFRAISYSISSSEPELILWNLMIIKRAHGFLNSTLPFEETQIDNYIVQLMFHNSPEVRAAAVCTSSVFCDCPFDERTYFILHSISALIFDQAFYVRNQVLLLAIRSLIKSAQHHAALFEQCIQASTFDSIFKHLFRTPRHFSEYTKDLPSFFEEIEKTVSATDDETMIRLMCFVIEYLCFDPCKIVRENALHARELLSSGKNPSEIATPIGTNNRTLDPFELAQMESSMEDTDFPSDSNALFNACGLQLINSKYWQPAEMFNPVRCRYTKIEQLKPMAIPNSSSLISKQHLPNTRAMKMAFRNDELIISGSNNLIYSLSSQKKTIERLFISSAAVSNLHATSDTIVVSTVDGCVHVFGNDQQEVEFRAGAGYRVSMMPQFASTSPLDSARIATARGNAGVLLWDLNTQKMIGEWSSRQDETVTALTMHQLELETCFFGSMSGSISLFDFRAPMSSVQATLSTHGNGIVKSLVCIPQRPQSIFAATNAGRVIEWDARNGNARTISVTNNQIVDMQSCRPSSTFLMSAAAEAPKIIDIQGALQLRFQGVHHGSAIAVHQTAPIVAFATGGSEIQFHKLGSA